MSLTKTPFAAIWYAVLPNNSWLCFWHMYQTGAVLLCSPAPQTNIPSGCHQFLYVSLSWPLFLWWICEEKIQQALFVQEMFVFVQCVLDRWVRIFYLAFVGKFWLRSFMTLRASTAGAARMRAAVWKLRSVRKDWERDNNEKLLFSNIQWIFIIPTN